MQVFSLRLPSESTPRVKDEDDVTMAMEHFNQLSIQDQASQRLQEILDSVKSLTAKEDLVKTLRSVFMSRFVIVEWFSTWIWAWAWLWCTLGETLLCIAALHPGVVNRNLIEKNHLKSKKIKEFHQSRKKVDSYIFSCPNSAHLDDLLCWLFRVLNASFSHYMKFWNFNQGKIWEIVFTLNAWNPDKGFFL